jgi:hypothetical protein
MNEICKIDENSQETFLAVTTNNELRNLQTDGYGRILYIMVTKLDNNSTNNEVSKKDANNNHTKIGLTKNKVIKNIKISNNGFVYFTK